MVETTLIEAPFEPRTFTLILWPLRVGKTYAVLQRISSERARGIFKKYIFVVPAWGDLAVPESGTGATAVDYARRLGIPYFIAGGKTKMCPPFGEKAANRETLRILDHKRLTRSLCAGCSRETNVGLLLRKRGFLPFVSPTSLAADAAYEAGVCPKSLGVAALLGLSGEGIAFTTIHILRQAVGEAQRLGIMEDWCRDLTCVWDEMHKAAAVFERHRSEDSFSFDVEEGDESPPLPRFLRAACANPTEISEQYGIPLPLLLDVIDEVKVAAGLAHFLDARARAFGDISLVERVLSDSAASQRKLRADIKNDKRARADTKALLLSLVESRGSGPPALGGYCPTALLAVVLHRAQWDWTVEEYAREVFGSMPDLSAELHPRRLAVDKALAALAQRSNDATSHAWAEVLKAYQESEGRVFWAEYSRGSNSARLHLVALEGRWNPRSVFGEGAVISLDLGPFHDIMAAGAAVVGITGTWPDTEQLNRIAFPFPIRKLPYPDDAPKPEARFIFEECVRGISASVDGDELSRNVLRLLRGISAAGIPEFYLVARNKREDKAAQKVRPLDVLHYFRDSASTGTTLVSADATTAPPILLLGPPNLPPTLLGAARGLWWEENATLGELSARWQREKMAQEVLQLAFRTTRVARDGAPGLAGTIVLLSGARAQPDIAEHAERYGMDIHWIPVPAKGKMESRARAIVARVKGSEPLSEKADFLLGAVGSREFSLKSLREDGMGTPRLLVAALAELHEAGLIMRTRRIRKEQFYTRAVDKVPRT